jgi:putative iron-regulated protein
MQKLKFIFIFLFLFACKKQNEQMLKTEVLTTYAQIAYLCYQDIYNQTKVLKSKIDTFLANPNEISFSQVKMEWLAVRNVYGQSEAFRFYGGPIDNPQYNLEAQINAWPLDESYIDYVEGNATSGIINDRSVALDRKILRSKNEQDGVEENVSIGYHAIEFLLWGQDLYEHSAGQRKYTDYVSAPNADRRKQYLSLCVELLLEDLAKLMKDWESTDSNNYRADFIKNTDNSLANILTGIGSLSRAELGGERMRVALVNHDQEDEQSCFSDNTHNELIANAQGIINIYEGKYKNFVGKGLFDLVKALDSDLALKTQENLVKTLERIKEIKPPFDREISAKNPEGNERIRKAINSLDEQTKNIESIAQTLGISINTKGS